MSGRRTPNIPGALNHAIRLTGEANEIDYALIDMSPSLGAINQNLFMTSDAFIIPMAPDLFSSMALRSLSRTLPKWAEWGKKAANNALLKSADYPFPDAQPKYLGSTVQNFRKRSRAGEEAKPTQAFQKWFDRLAKTRETDLLQALEQANMLLGDAVYRDANASTSEFLMEISSLDGLIATAQELAKPVFAIDLLSDTSFKGKVADIYQSKIDDIYYRFYQGAKKIIALTDYFWRHGTLQRCHCHLRACDAASTADGGFVRCSLRPGDTANDDALRSSYIQAVSSFDFSLMSLQP